MGIFKAYDIRGVVPDDLDEALAERIGRATVGALNAGSVLVSRDMRESGVPLSKALVRGLRAAGADVIDAGMTSTPMNYFACGEYGTGASIMVTASHNPSRYNGFKMSGPGASPVSYETGLGEIERRVIEGEFPSAAKPGALEKRDVLADYKAFLGRFKEGIRPGLKVVVDTGNGIEGAFFDALYDDLGLEVTPLYFKPDGSFPNHEPNPLKYENLRDLQAKVRAERADLGIAFDGDTDRVAFVDERGEIVSSDLVTALMAPTMLRTEPAGRVVVHDLRSSRAVAEEIRAHGGTPVETRVGHSYMKAVLREREGVFGGELSGHYYFRDAYGCDTGDVAMLVVLGILSKSEAPMSELIRPLRRYCATGEINFEVEDKDGRIEAVARAFADAELSRLDGISVAYPDWWCTVRKSNTEPILRLTLEAASPEARDRGRAAVEAVITAKG